jgi:hypothetical protein
VATMRIPSVVHRYYNLREGSFWCRPITQARPRGFRRAAVHQARASASRECCNLRGRRLATQFPHIYLTGPLFALAYAFAARFCPQTRRFLPASLSAPKGLKRPRRQTTSKGRIFKISFAKYISPDQNIS